MIDPIIGGVDYICDRIQDEKNKHRVGAALYAVAFTVNVFALLNLISNMKFDLKSNYCIIPFRFKCVPGIVNNNPAYISHILSISAIMYKIYQYMILSFLCYDKSNRPPDPVNHHVTPVNIPEG